MISISITDSSGEKFQHSIARAEGAQCSIGRDESCDIALPSETYLSRVHCIISYTNGQLTIQDNQSRNGVFLGNQRINFDFLNLNQEYKLGQCTMIAEEIEGEQDYTPAAYPQAYPQEYAQAYPSPTQGYPQAYPAPSQGYPQSYPPTQGYPQPYPQQAQEYPPQAYPAQPYPPQQAYQAYPQAQAYPQPMEYPQAQTYPQPTAYPQAQAYPQPMEYPQAQAYPQPTEYPQAQAYPQPTEYPQAQAYPQPTEYPQAQAYPQPTEYPQAQAYPQPTEYPQAQAYPQPTEYPQAQEYPQPTEYPQAQEYPQPTEYPQPVEYPQAQEYAQPEEEYPQVQEYPQEESIPVEAPQAEELPSEEAVSMEDLLTHELESHSETPSLKDKWMGLMSSSLSAGKNRLKDLIKSHKSKSKAVEETGETPSEPQAEAPAAPQPETPDQPTEEPIPAAEEPAPAVSESTPPSQEEDPVSAAPEPQPEKPEPTAAAAAPTPKEEKEAKQGKVLVRKPSKKRRNNTPPAPEIQVNSIPGNILGMPYDFELSARVTTNMPSFVQEAPLRFHVRTQQDCRVFIISHDSDGGVELIMPGQKGADNLVFSSVEAKFPGMGHQDYLLMVEPPFGQEVITILAFGSTQKCDFEKSLREVLKQSAGKTPGEAENDAIAHFCQKKPKLNNIPWSSTVLHLNTHPRPEEPAEAGSAEQC